MEQCGLLSTSWADVSDFTQYSFPVYITAAGYKCGQHVWPAHHWMWSLIELWLWKPLFSMTNHWSPLFPTANHWTLLFSVTHLWLLWFPMTNHWSPSFLVTNHSSPLFPAHHLVGSLTELRLSMPLFPLRPKLITIVLATTHYWSLLFPTANH